MKHIGHYMKQIRERMGLDVSELADRLGWITGYLRDVERGITSPLESEDEEFDNVTGISPHKYAVVKDGETGHLPRILRGSAAALTAMWDQDVAAWEAKYPQTGGR